MPVIGWTPSTLIRGILGGKAQADAYIKGLFARFQAIVDHNFPWRAIPADFGVEGFVCRYEKHFIYWRLLPDGSVGIATILHERMHQIGRFRDDIDERTKSL